MSFSNSLKQSVIKNGVCGVRDPSLFRELKNKTNVPTNSCSCPVRRRTRDDEIQRAFIRYLVLVHLPTIYGALRMMAEQQGITLDEMPIRRRYIGSQTNSETSKAEVHVWAIWLRLAPGERAGRKQGAVRTPENVLQALPGVLTLPAPNHAERDNRAAKRLCRLLPLRNAKKELDIASHKIYYVNHKIRLNSHVFGPFVKGLSALPFSPPLPRPLPLHVPFWTAS
jgi:hypothetical protein